MQKKDEFMCFELGLYHGRGTNVKVTLGQCWQVKLRLLFREQKG